MEDPISDSKPALRPVSWRRVVATRLVVGLCMALPLLFVSAGLPGSHGAVAAIEASKDDTAAIAQARFALVVGVSRVGESRSDTALGNARAMSEKLETLGFTVELAQNISASKMQEALDRLSARRAAGDVVFFYFSGLDLKTGGSKALLTADTVVTPQGDAVRHAVRIDAVLRALNKVPGSAAKMVVLDTAPYPLRGKTRGLKLSDATPKAPANTLIAQSNAQQGDVAREGPLSLFTATLVNRLGETDRPVESLFQSVKVAVRDRTNGAQVPSHRSTMTEDLVLGDGGRASAGAASKIDEEASVVKRGIKLSEQEAPQARLENRPARGSETAQATERAPGFESALWGMIQESKNPADFEAYLEVFPSGQFSAQAKQKLSALRAPTKPPAPAAPQIEAMQADFVLRVPANIRALPNTSARVVGRGKKGEKFKVTGRVVGANWYRVQTRKGETAFVASNLLSEAPKAPPPEIKQDKVAVAPPRLPKSTPPARSGESFRDCPECPEMVSIPAGSFRMGSDRGDVSERPAHRVRISRPFAVGKFEITIAQWNTCLAAGGCSYKPRIKNAAENAPVHKLSWKDIQQYLGWLRKVTGKPYRLLTESEWEYAARGGATQTYWWGDRMTVGMADCKDCGGNWNYKAPAPVDSSKPNPFGLYGMSGGVWEWTDDCWRANYDRAPTDGSAQKGGDCGARVLRGGSWRNDASYARAASRLRYDFNVRYSTNGFRVARDLP